MRRVPTLLATVLLALVVGACGSSTPTLDGAIGTIPVFTPAKLLDRRSAYTSDDIGNPMKFSTYTWELETERSPADVQAFYVAQWPGAGIVEDETEVTIRTPPLPDDEATPLGESVLVTIQREREGGKTKFSISEDVFANRRP